METQTRTDEIVLAGPGENNSFGIYQRFEKGGELYNEIEGIVRREKALDKRIPIWFYHYRDRLHGSLVAPTGGAELIGIADSEEELPQKMYEVARRHTQKLAGICSRTRPYRFIEVAKDDLKGTLVSALWVDPLDYRDFPE